MLISRSCGPEWACVLPRSLGHAAEPPFLEVQEALNINEAKDHALGAPCPPRTSLNVTSEGMYKEEARPGEVHTIPTHPGMFRAVHTEGTSGLREGRWAVYVKCFRRLAEMSNLKGPPVGQHHPMPGTFVRNENDWALPPTC